MNVCHKKMSKEEEEKEYIYLQFLYLLAILMYDREV